MSRRDLGLVAFLAITLGGTWAACAVLLAAGPDLERGMTTRLLGTSLVYGLTMGWQPLLAVGVVRRWLGEPVTFGGRAARGQAVALTLALALVALAAALAWLGGRVGLAAAASLHGAAEAELGARPASLANATLLGLAFLGTVTFVGVQSLGEELGWRGYFLERLMAALGRWEGLLLHGVAWGLWYAPVLLLGGGATAAPTRTIGGALVTCSLLGVFLGGLRLAFRSVAPAFAANATITLAAGLPYVLSGADAGLRGALFGPAGWLATTLLCGTLFAIRGRALLE